jgi:hypothetical protein
MSLPRVVVVEEEEVILLTVPGAVGKSCVYVSLERGKLVLVGGADIIERIEGKGMADKILKTGPASR